jgi:hypothetical protein
VPGVFPCIGRRKRVCPGKIYDILKRENSTFGRFPECLFWKRGDSPVYFKPERGESERQHKEGLRFHRKIEKSVPGEQTRFLTSCRMKKSDEYLEVRF